MAKIYPRISNSETESSAERRLYEAFRRELSNDWMVFHHVKRTGKINGRLRDGEADFVIAHARLGVLVLEVKGGRIHFDEVTGHYWSTDRDGVAHDIGDPFWQAQENKKWLIDYMRGKLGWPNARIIFGHAVAFPHMIVEGDWLRPNAPRDIILDHNDLLALEEWLKHILNHCRGVGEVPPGREGVDTLKRLLSQSTHIRNPLLKERVSTDEHQFYQLTQDQYDVMIGLDRNRRAVIRGCAGSGKTILAVEKARRLAQNDELKVLYTCFNEALADFIGRELDRRGLFDVFSYYSLVKHWGRQAGLFVPEDYRTITDRQTFFEKTLPDFLLEAIDKTGPQYDAIVLDEMQDFYQKWWDSLFFLLYDSGGGIFYAFGDDQQRIFPSPRSQKHVSEAPGFVEYSLSYNCRNTRTIAELVSRFYQGRHLPKSKGPEGMPVEIIAYKTYRQMCDHLRHILHRLICEEHLSNQDVVVLTLRHSRKSEDLPGPPSEIADLRLGNFQLSGKLPLEPMQVLTKSIYSFKGLERPVVIIGEIDDQIPEDHLQTLLYAAISRAKSHLIMLVSEKVSPTMWERLRS
jgi:hypothetical protein